MRRPGWPAGWSASTVGVVALALVAVGAAAGGLLRPGPAPASLTASASAASVPVVLEPFDDSTDVEMQVSQGPARPVVAAASGTVTSLRCSPGGSVVSGSQLLAVDGQAIVALATSVPFWRDLSPGTRGADVSALQQELNRLGQPVARTGYYGTGTRLALAKVFTAAGAAWPADGRLPRSRTVWLPARRVRVTSCDVALGGTISAGSSILTTPVVVSKISIKALPDDRAPGARTLVLGGVHVATNAAGVVSDPASLAKLSATALYQAYVSSKGAVPLRGSWVLTKPIQAAAVPPSSLIGLDDTRFCVQTTTSTVPVTVVSSLAGRSIVTFPAGATPPSTVRVQPEAGARCG